MRKIFAVLLVAAQLLFPVSLAVSLRISEQRLDEAEECIFYAGTLEYNCYYEEDSEIFVMAELPFNGDLPKEGKFVKVETGEDGISAFHFSDKKPKDALYVSGEKFKANAYFVCSSDVIKILPSPEGGWYCSGFEDGRFTDAEYGSFSVVLKAKIRDGRMKYTDMLIDGKSIAPYCRELL